MTLWLVSRCLLGEHCRYDGRARPNNAVLSLTRQGVRLLPICPECDGGLPTPRTPSEIQGGDGADVLDGRARVMSIDGLDRTEAFLQGAHKALLLAQKENAQGAILKAKSPSCGSGRIYDGRFSGSLVAGDGVTTALLRRAGFRIRSESDFSEEI